LEAVKSKIVNRAAIAQKPAASVKQVQRQVVTNRSSVQVQTSTKVSSPHDAAEKEADTTSKKIMRMAIPESSIAYVKTDSGGLFRQVKQEEKEKKVQTKLRSPYINRFADSGLFTQRKAEGENTIAPSVSADIQNNMSSGSPLPMGVRRFMEPRFRADFSKVKIHTGDKSAKLNKQVNAQAFAIGNHVFFGKNKFQPESHEGKELIAHELTHTIQQGSVVQRSEDIAIAQQSPTQIQRLGLSDALNYFADKANLIPGFRMFTIVLGVNPINMNAVDRSAANIMRAIVEFIPGGGFVTQALDNHGVFEKVGNWVEQQIKTLGMVGSAIKQAVTQFLDSLGWRDIFDLGGVWDRAKSIFTDPINRIINFAKGLITGILKFVKDAILKPLAALAQGTRGYDLLKAILGEDPVTGEAVPRNADTLIGGFMKLIGQEEVWENIKKGKAIERAWAWFQGALAGLMGMVRAVPPKIISTITSLTIQDIVTVAGAFTKIVSAFANIAIDFISWGLKQVIGLLEIIFSVVAPEVMPYIKKAQAAFMTIIKNPIAFIGNLVRAGKQGFQMFASNILEHLKAALIKWITGPLGEAGVYIPQSFSLIEIVKLVLSVLGLTWQNIRSKLVKIIPEPVLVVIEKTAGILVTLVKDGPAAAWEQIKSELSELKDQMIAQVTQMITTEVVKAAITKLVSMINPAGAFVQAVLAIYNTVMFFVEKIKQIAAVAASFIDSISAIANGQVDNAAKKVEMTMANTLTIVIAFLAKFAGLGNIPDKVVGIIKKIRAPIDKGLDKIVAWLGKMLEKVREAIFGKKDTAKESLIPVKERWEKGMAEVNKYADKLKDREFDATKFKEGLAPISTKYGFVKLNLIEEGSGFVIEAEMNPKTKKKVDDSKLVLKDKIKPYNPADALEPKKYRDFDESNRGNIHLYYRDANDTEWYWIPTGKTTGSWRKSNDNKLQKKAEETARKKIQKDIPTFITFVDDDKGLTESGFDVAGIAKDDKTTLDLLIIGEVKAFRGEASRYVQYLPKNLVGTTQPSGRERENKLSAITDNMRKNLQSALAQPTGKKGKALVKRAESALKAGNVEIIFYLAGSATISNGTLDKVQSRVRQVLAGFLQTEFKMSREDISKIIKNVTVKTKNIKVKV
jgi:hypothetical protein